MEEGIRKYPEIDRSRILTEEEAGAIRARQPIEKDTLLGTLMKYPHVPVILFVVLALAAQAAITSYFMPRRVVSCWSIPVMGNAQVQGIAQCEIIDARSGEYIGSIKPVLR